MSTTRVALLKVGTMRFRSYARSEEARAIEAVEPMVNMILRAFR